MIPLNPLAVDQKALAEHKWQAPTKAAKAQLPCDHGLFSDERGRGLASSPLPSPAARRP